MNLHVGRVVCALPLLLWLPAVVALLPTQAAAGTPPPPYAHFPEPPGGALDKLDDWLASVCGSGPASWPVVELTADMAANAMRRPGKRVPRTVRVRVHARPDGSAYSDMDFVDHDCVEVTGVPGADGALPRIRSIGHRHGSGESLEPAAAGLIVRNMHVSLASADCIRIGPSRSFLVVSNSVVEKCGHHSLLVTGRHTYVRLENSRFRLGHSHAIYTQNVARADVFDNVFESPGWGHALRIIATNFDVRRNIISNVRADGGIDGPGSNPRKPKREYVGQHPFEVKACSSGTVADNDIIYYAATGKESGREGNIGVASQFRTRRALSSCDLGEVRPASATRAELRPRMPSYYEANTWQRMRDAGENGRFRIRLERNRFFFVGPESHRAQAWRFAYTFPTLDDKGTREFNRLLREKREALGKPRYAALREMLMKDASIPDDYRDILARVTQPRRFLAGGLPGQIPLRMPPGYFERQHIHLYDTSVQACEGYDVAARSGVGCIGVVTPLTALDDDSLLVCAELARNGRATGCSPARNDPLSHRAMVRCGRFDAARSTARECERVQRRLVRPRADPARAWIDYGAGLSMKAQWDDPANPPKTTGGGPRQAYIHFEH